MALLTQKPAIHIAKNQMKNNPVIQHPVSLRSILKVSSRLILGHRRSRFPRASPAKILHVILLSPHLNFNTS
jgi:hypothetical protein